MNAIGLMIAAYIVMRCVEVMAKPAASFSGRSARGVAILGAAVCLVCTLALSVDLFVSAATTAAARTVTQDDVDGERNRREVEELLRKGRR